MSDTEEITGGASKGMDMLHGPMAKKIFLFALPIGASSILQQLFNSADVAVAGRFAKEGALAAVGSNSVLVGLFVNIFVGLAIGANVVISNKIGKQKTDDVSKVVHTAVLFAVLCGLFMMTVGILISRPLLMLIDAPADVLDRAVIYLRIYCLGMPFIIPYNFGAAILRSIGDTKRPMYCLMASGCINVCLNLLLVIVFHLDVAGVAISTVVSNICSSSAVFYILFHEDELIRLHLKKLRIDWDSFRAIFRIGAPASLQSAVFSLSNICLQTAINGFGSAAVAGMTAALNFEYFTYYMINAFNQSVITFIGQNYGARQYDRCKKAFRICALESVCGTLLMNAVFILGSPLLVRLYTVKSVEIAYAMVRFHYVMPFQFIGNSYEITGSALRGTGHSLVPALITVVGSVIFRVIWVYKIFPIWGSFMSLLIVYPISWAFTGAMMVTYYFAARRSIYS